MAAFKVLVPLDGSRTAEHSLVYLDALKRLGDCTVTLLSVADDTEEYHGEASGEAIEREANLLGTYLREVARDVTNHVHVAVDAKVVRGKPVACMAEEIETSKPDVLVISTHGRSGVSRWRFGSVADKVIRSATCTTLIVGPKAHEEEVWIDAGAELPFKSIMVPLDGSDLAGQAVPVAVRYAECFGSTLHVVRAVTTPLYTDGMVGEGAYMPDLLTSLEDAAKQDVGNVAAMVGTKVKVVAEVLLGDPASQLENYVKTHGIDLVVMTTHGRGGFSRTALGSVTDRLLAEGSAPVLVVRPGQ